MGLKGKSFEQGGRLLIIGWANPPGAEPARFHGGAATAAPYPEEEERFRQHGLELPSCHGQRGRRQKRAGNGMSTQYILRTTTYLCTSSKNELTRNGGNTADKTYQAETSPPHANGSLVSLTHVDVTKKMLYISVVVRRLIHHSCVSMQHVCIRHD